MDFYGEFETHITVALDGTHAWERFRTWCEVQGLKCVHIALERGQRPSQPMLTRQGTGTLSSELQVAEELCRACETAGFSVLRIKLEVPPWSEDVPRNHSQSYAKDDRYFEHHIKLLMPPIIKDEALIRLANSHGAHLSRNARRLRNDGLQERFVTQRCYHIGRDEAQRRFEELMEALGDLPYPVVETEQEYVVFDSNVSLDAGWLDNEKLG